MNNINIEANLAERNQDRVQRLFKNADSYRMNFIKFSNDLGVILNGGRKGSEYGPMAILNLFKKMPILKNLAMKEVEICQKVVTNFNENQKNNIHATFEVLKNSKSDLNVYLGGGHDHIYTSLISLTKIFPDQKIIIVNLDPHLDTRKDSIFHSGTPFRQFDLNSENSFKLIQIGTQALANNNSTRENLAKGSQKIIGIDEVLNFLSYKNQSQDFWKLHFKYEENAVYFFSLDVDVLDASIMEGVSAVNGRGLPFEFILSGFRYFKNELNCKNFGIYEYNPVYDNLSQKGARAICHLIYDLAFL